MKRLLLFLMAVLLGISSMQLSAQQTIEIGTGTGTTYYGPYNSLWGYSFVEQIYTATEIGTPGIITSISFNMQSTDSQTNNITVYMKNVSRSSFSSTTDYETVTAADIVYSGSYTFTNGWNTITLTTPFLYDGSNNLMIAFHENTSGYSTRYFYYTSITNALISFHSDSSDPDPYNLGSYGGTIYTQSNRPNIRIEISAGNLGCLSMTPTVSNVGPYTADLNWMNFQQSASNWDILYGETGTFDTLSGGILLTGITDTFYTLSGLTAATTYSVYMKSHCSSDDGTWSAPRTFTTTAACPTPTNLVVTGHTAEEVTVSWMPGADETGWEVACVPHGTPVGAGTPEYATSSPYTIYNLTDNTQYDVYVRADCGNGENSYWTSAVTFTTDPYCTPPTNVSVSQIQGASALVTWNYAQVGATGYTVGYSEAGMDNWITQTVTGNNYMLSGLTPNTAYDVFVYSECVQGNVDTVYGSFSTHCLAGGEITIGNGTTTNYYIPVNNYYHYTYSQQIYLASEMGGPSDITSVSFEYSYGTAMTDKTNVDIYLGHTTQSAFTSTSNYIPATGLQLVYHGNLNCQQGWNEFVFDTVFHYNGTDNLVLVVDDNSDDYNGTAYVFRVHSAGANRSLYYYSDSNNPSPSDPTAVSTNSSYSSGNRSNVKFGGDCDLTITCIAPNLYISEVTAESVTVGWAPGNTETSWELEYSADNINWIPEGFVTTSPYTITNLSANTLYYFRLRSDCGGEYSDWAQVSVRTDCGALAQMPFTENFDTYGTGEGHYPDCWGKINTYSSDRPYVNSTNYAGGGSLYFYTGTSGTYNMAIIPQVDATIPVNTLVATFMYRANSTSDRLIVGVMSDPSTPNTFVPVDTIAPGSTATAWEEREVIFANYTGSGQYIAFKNAYTTTNAYAYVDNLVIDLIPECPRPNDVIATDTTTNTITLSWTELGTATSWVVTYGPAGFTPGPNSGTTETVYSLPHTITGLSASTSYDFYVQSDCGGNYSNYSTVSTISTACDAITALPFTEQFDAYGTGVATAYPPCWAKYSTYTASTALPYCSSTHYEGAGSLYLYVGTSGTYNMAITPPFDATIPVNTLMATFMYRASNSTDRTIVGVMGSPTDPTTFVPVDTLYPASTASTWEMRQVSFGQYTGTGQYIAFKNEYTTTGCYTYVDNLSIDLIPACPSPTSLTATSGASDTVVLSWSDPTGTSWDIAYGPTGFNPGSDVTATIEYGVTDNPYTFTGLAAGVVYDFYVRTNCGNGEYSPWSYMPATAAPYQIQMGITGSSSVTGCGFTVTDNGGAGGDYANYCDYTLTIYPSSPDSLVSIAGVFVGESTIDYLSIYDGTTANAGNLIVKITSGTSGNQVNFGPLTSESGPLTLLFHSDVSVVYPGFVATVNCVAAPTCIKPSDFSISNVTSSSVTLTWHEGGNATNWNIAYGPVGFTIDDNTTIEFATDTTITIEYLTFGQTYDFYVQSDCGGEVSDWRGPLTVSPGTFTFGVTGSSSITACDLIVYDDGGPNGTYSNYCDYTLTIYPTEPDSVVSVSGIFTGESTLDYLSIYEGTTVTEANLLIKITSGTSGTQINFGPLTSETGPLTLYFHSDVSAVYAGFAATVSCAAAPTCPKPYNIQASDLTTNSVTLTWSQNGTATSWDIEYGPSGFTPGTGTVETAYNSPYTVTGLSASTSYDFYVIADCSGDSSDYSNACTVATACDAITQLPFTENFDNYGTGTATAYPPCWSKYTTYTASTALPYCSSTHYAGVGSLYFYVATAGTYNMAITPPFDVTIPVNTLQATFMHRGTNSTDRTIVGVMSNPTDPTTFVAVDTIYPGSPVSTWVEQEVVFSNYTGSGQYIVFRNEYTSTSCYTYIDNLSIDLIPACPKPKNLTTSSPTANSINLSWTEMGSATAWVVEYGPVGFTLGTGTTLNVTGTPSTTVSGLSASGTYDFYVKSECGGGDMSPWSAKATGSTLCDAITQLPYTENFDANPWTSLPGSGATALMPNCWERLNTYSSPRPFCYQYANNMYNNTPMLYFYATSGNYNIAIMPEVDSSIPVNTLKVTFMYRGFSSSFTTPLSVGVMTDPTNPSTYVEVATVPFDASVTNWVSREVSFANYTGTGQFIAFKNGGVSATCYAMMENLVLDYEDSTLVNTCEVPTGLAVSNVTTNTATATWTAGGTETSWNVQYKAASASNWQSATANATSYTMTNLTPGTAYQVRVQANCGSGEVSTWTNPVSFTTDQEQQQTCPAPTNLTATVDHTDVTLTWQQEPNTANEWQINYRLATESTWSTVTVTSTTYTLTDLTANAQYVANVVAHCTNGLTSDESNTVTFETNNIGVEDYLNKAVTLYPNPATEMVSVAVSDANIMITGVEVYNVYGQLINTIVSTENPLRINVSGLADGMY
ncbi:MAG: fibronectin type III domain-containing protein, partial [Bacteroidales bacterium]|nr:fibronectin type III domain-containing protein [Bacteroidales bacterium]